jgi:hypothetical protein
MFAAPLLLLPNHLFCFFRAIVGHTAMLLVCLQMDNQTGKILFTSQNLFLVCVIKLTGKFIITVKHVFRGHDLWDKEKMAL